MPVRPLTEGEYKIANGEPVSTWLAVFGASQGFLTHLRMNGLNAGAKHLMPTPFAKVTLPVLLLGGAAAGAATGTYFFGDDQLRRLAASHNQDRVTMTHAQTYTSQQ